MNTELASSVRMHSCTAIVACLAFVVGGTSLGRAQMLKTSSVRESVATLENNQVSCLEVTFRLSGIFLEWDISSWHPRSELSRVLTSFRLFPLF